MGDELKRNEELVDDTCITGVSISSLGDMIGEEDFDEVVVVLDVLDEGDNVYLTREDLIQLLSFMGENDE